MVYFAVAFASGLLEKVDKAHDINHAKRVYLNALKILDSGIKADREVVLTCAVLHDIVDHKLFKNDENLDDFFAIYPTDKEYQIRTVISEVSFSSGKKCTSVESEIVQDADRLDAIGAVGVARAFAYGGKLDRPLYGEEESTINHFYEKLLKIKDLLNTEKAKEIAVSRHEFLRQFLEQFYDEIE
ncbi:MAG: phosphohydrolase [Clostridia bacterium]|nr:phosphohydrolase [Clostridia bacterium]